MDQELKSLAVAVVIQAVSDWRFLCNGGTATGDCNFEELEQFFERECENYLSGTDMSASEIYEKLKAERAIAERRWRKVDT